MVPKYSYQLILLFTILSLVGCALVTQLSFQLSPSKSSGSIMVSYKLPNTSPKVIEQQVTSKVEGAISVLPGIRKISSSSQYSYGQIIIDLDRNINIDQARFEVAMIIRQIYHHLPKETSYPLIQLNTPEQDKEHESLMRIQVSGNDPIQELKKYVDQQVVPSLSSIEGIYDVKVFGGNSSEWIVVYEQKFIDALGLKESDIIKSVEKHFKRENIGISETAKGKRISIILNYTIDNLDPWKIPIGIKDNRVVYLKDIAHVNKRERSPSNFYRVNGINALTIVINANKGVNQIQLSTITRKHLEEIAKRLPASYELNIEYDSSKFIKENLLKTILQTGLAILILVLFVWIMSRKLWYIGIIVASLIANLSFSFILFYAFQIEIHLYSLAAIAASIGIIIDNTIVMIDHYQRYRNLKVFTSLVGATLTTIAGLIVIFFLPEEKRIYLSDFSIVMVITLMTSLPVALLFVPSLMERLSYIIYTNMDKANQSVKLKVRLSQLYYNYIVILKKFSMYAYLSALLCFGIPIFLLPESIGANHVGAHYYNTLAKYDWYKDNVKPSLEKYLGGSLRLFVKYVYETSYSKDPDRTVLHIHIGLPNNSTIEQMNTIFKQIESRITKYSEIDNYVTNIISAQNGLLSIEFTPSAEKQGFAYTLKNIMIQFSTEMSGMDWDIYGVGQGFSETETNRETPTFTVKMTGYNYNELEKQANSLAEILKKHPRIQEVDIDKSLNWQNRKDLYEYNLVEDNRRFAINKIEKKNLFRMQSQLSAQPNEDSFIFYDNEYYPIKVIPLESQNRDLWQLENQLLKQDSSAIKMKGLYRIVRKKVMPEIIKENQEYIRIVNFTYFGRSDYGEEFLDKTLLEFNSKLPLGYKAKKEKHNWLTEDKQTKIWLIFLIFLLIYIICAIIFESLLQPLALIIIIPLSFIGVFLTFYFFDFNFDQGGYASFVLLSGNVVCTGIFIIVEYNSLKARRPSISPIKLYVKAFNHKIIPILATVISTIVGLIPFLIYGENEAFWFSFGVGTIGGLLMSLIVLFVYFPLFLALYDK